MAMHGYPKHNKPDFSRLSDKELQKIAKGNTLHSIGRGTIWGLSGLGMLASLPFLCSPMPLLGLANMAVFAPLHIAVIDKMEKRGATKKAAQKEIQKRKNPVRIDNLPKLLPAPSTSAFNANAKQNETVAKATPKPRALNI